MRGESRKTFQLLRPIFRKFSLLAMPHCVYRDFFLTTGKNLQVPLTTHKQATYVLTNNVKKNFVSDVF